jgi:hypothetical protein
MLFGDKFNAYASPIADKFYILTRDEEIPDIDDDSFKRK